MSTTNGRLFTEAQERIAIATASIAKDFNDSGMAERMLQAKNAMLSLVLNQVQQSLGSNSVELEQGDAEALLLNSVGPAAASAAMDYALSHCKANSLLKNQYTSSDYVTNLKLVRNDEGFPNFASTLRQFLLPRYAYLDFDSMIDPRHMIDRECGYPKFITPIMYRYMYDRDDVASRVVDIFPDESWAVDPCIYENEDEDTPNTGFEEDWENLCHNQRIMQMLYRMDKLAGVGHYGSLLIGIDDGKELDQPVDGILPNGLPDPAYKGEHGLLYLRPFDEYLSFIQQYETNVNNPRYGLPVIYNLVFLDMTIDAAGASIGTRLNRRVHWTRVVHVADNLQSSLVFGIPRQQQVFNRLLDLRKIKGGSAEMLWKGGFPGIAFEVDPEFVADNPEFDRKAFKEAIENYSNGLSRYLDLIGIKANTLSPNIAANPDQYVTLQMQAIASSKGIPLRVFLGSEEGRLASSQDAVTWNKRLTRKLKTFTEPGLIRNVIDRFVALRIMRPPESGRYYVEWGDLNTPTDEDSANLALKYTQALSQYVATGMIHLMKPMDYFTIVMRFKPSISRRIVDAVDSQGGWTKLLNVDPSQGAGVNGTRQNLVNGDQGEGTSRERPKERNTSTKSAEGSSS